MTPILTGPAGVGVGVAIGVGVGLGVDGAVVVGGGVGVAVSTGVDVAIVVGAGVFSSLPPPQAGNITRSNMLKTVNTTNHRFI